MEIIQTKPIVPSREAMQNTFEDYLAQPNPPLEVVFPVFNEGKISKWIYRLTKAPDGCKYYAPIENDFGD